MDYYNSVKVVFVVQDISRMILRVNFSGMCPTVLCNIQPVYIRKCMVHVR